MWTRTTSVSILLGALIAGLFLVPLAATSGGNQEAKPDWSQVQVVTYSSGLTGFFDAATGKLYLYDSNLDECFLIREVEELGKPLKKIKN
jgi:hypothetical protein